MSDNRDPDDKQKPRQQQGMIVGLPLGVAIGVALGVAHDQRKND
jgi:hypothetical protein